MRVDEIYSLYRVERVLEKPERYTPEELLEKVKLAADILERIAFRRTISKELWRKLEGEQGEESES